eukprot:SAG31_NODE_1179_length_9530_cov_8.153748_8_plen_127_part_00
MFVGAAVCAVADDVDGIRHGQAGIVLQLSAAGWVTVQFQNDGIEVSDAFAAPLVRTVKTNSVKAIDDTVLAASVSDFRRVMFTINVLLLVIECIHLMIDQVSNCTGRSELTLVPAFMNEYGCCNRG